MKIEFDPNPNKSDIDFLTNKINQETEDYGQATPFGFFIKNSNHKIIAGANGFILYGSVYTDQLWVLPECRGRGLAKKLMEAIHAHGKHQKCKIATVQTMEFQEAAEFYKKLGYVQDFKRSGYIKNSYCIFLKKEL
ncbi:N-acetyltransferase [uncultured Legionella sp.]|uniref:GNAT family N-acetyltransferase n=1 Tax=uncultured Legionella sp. TaxID=210934 RepID=UPI002628C853|nr:GNAT family N-acetyltransferase [uncultured Legionella sp.]